MGHLFRFVLVFVVYITNWAVSKIFNEEKKLMNVVLILMYKSEFIKSCKMLVNERNVLA